MQTLTVLAAAQQNDNAMALCGFVLAVGIILVVVGGFAPIPRRHTRLRLVLTGLVVGGGAFLYLVMG